jgi:hypothetical protein
VEEQPQWLSNLEEQPQWLSNLEEEAEDEDEEEVLG